MALKKQQSLLDTLSMASMTDVVFLLLVFFMVTSTFIFPTAMEVNLPQSSEQVPLKPVTRVYVLADGSVAGQYGENEPVALVSDEEIAMFLNQVAVQDSVTAIAVYGDTEVDYGRVVDVLNLGARNNLKMVLATTPRSDAQIPEGAKLETVNEIETVD